MSLYTFPDTRVGVLELKNGCGKCDVYKSIFGYLSLMADLKEPSLRLQILAYLQSRPSRFLDSSISKIIGSYEFIFRKQWSICMNIHKNNVPGAFSG